MTEQPEKAKANRKVLSPEEVERLRTLVGFNPERDTDTRNRRGWARKNIKPPDTEE